MPDLNLSPDYFDHPKTVRLVQLLGKGAAELPLRLWCYCSKHHRADGRLTAYTPEQIEASIEWRGQPGRAVTALLECGRHIGKMGFLETTEDGYQVHDWEEHQGHLERYHQAAIAGAKARWAKRAPKESGSPPDDANRIANRNANRSPNRNAPATLGNAYTPPTPSRLEAPASHGVSAPSLSPGLSDGKDRPRLTTAQTRGLVGAHQASGLRPLNEAPEWVHRELRRPEGASEEVLELVRRWQRGEDVAPPERKTA